MGHQYQEQQQYQEEQQYQEQQQQQQHPYEQSPKKSYTLLIQLMFRIYDGYQKKGTIITRDTLRRFLSDIHGDECSTNTVVTDVLDDMFLNFENNDDAATDNESADKNYNKKDVSSGNIKNGSSSTTTTTRRGSFGKNGGKGKSADKNKGSSSSSTSTTITPTTTPTTTPKLNPIKKGPLLNHLNPSSFIDAVL